MCTLKARPKLGQRSKGQTLAEYATILLAIAVLVYGGYLVFGNQVASLVNSVNPLF
jgi:Flp pilus assembly pilin Flp